MLKGGQASEREDHRALDGSSRTPQPGLGVCRRCSISECTKTGNHQRQEIYEVTEKETDFKRECTEKLDLIETEKTRHELRHEGLKGKAILFGLWSHPRGKKSN